jgi:hypothetical protein
VSQSWEQSLSTGDQHFWHDAFAQATAIHETSSDGPSPEDEQQGPAPGTVVVRSADSLLTVGSLLRPGRTEPIVDAATDSAGASALANPEAPHRPDSIPSSAVTQSSAPVPLDPSAACAGAGSAQNLEAGMPGNARQTAIKAFSARIHTDAEGGATLYLRAAGWTGAEALAWAADAIRWRPAGRRLHLAEIVLNGQSVYKSSPDAMDASSLAPLRGVVVIA